MKRSRIGPWIALIFGATYFVVPLIATFEFSLRIRRGQYTFDAYKIVFADPRFQATFTYSTLIALATIIVGALLVVPTAYWVRLRLPRLRPVVEFITLLPLVIPPIIVVYGYLQGLQHVLDPADDLVGAADGPAARPRLRDAWACPTCTAPSTPACAPSTSAR